MRCSSFFTSNFANQQIIIYFACTKTHTMVIAIDPDIEKSGFAIIADGELKRAGVLPFPDLCDMLRQEGTGEGVVVWVEAGWLNSSIWHNAYQQGARVTSRIAKNTGANHQTGKHIVEMAEHYGLEVHLQKPLVKRWAGSDGKITQPELERVLSSNKIKYTKQRMNQDCRDAVLIAILHYGEF